MTQITKRLREIKTEIKKTIESNNIPKNEQQIRKEVEKAFEKEDIFKNSFCYCDYCIWYIDRYIVSYQIFEPLLETNSKTEGIEYYISLLREKKLI